jgi:hypothetical protein
VEDQDGPRSGLDADLLNGLYGTNYAGSAHIHDDLHWQFLGNSGTTPATYFVGTTDNQRMELKVNNGRAFRLEPNGDVEVSWPLWADDYLLEHAPTVAGSPDRWDDVSPATYQTDGTRFYVTIPAPSAARFYRLHQVCLGP